MSPAERFPSPADVPPGILPSASARTSSNAAPNLASGSASHRPPRGTPLVLLVIGESAARVALRKALERGGLAVAESSDATACLDAYERLDPDVVIVGPMLSETDGHRTCSLLRSRSGARRTPLIMLTDSADAGSIQRAYDAGAHDFITQPVDAAQAVQRVRFVLRVACDAAGLERGASRPVLPERVARLGSWELCADHSAIVCSDQAREILGIPTQSSHTTVDALVGSVPSDDRLRLRGWLAEVASGGAPAPLQHSLSLADGAQRIVRHEAHPIRDACSGRIRMRVFVEEIAESPHGKLMLSSDGDGSFVLADLEQLLGNLRAGMAEAKSSQRHAAVLCVDLNRFKVVTASLSHSACERLLVDIARRLRVGIRDDDVLARLGCGTGDISIARLRGDEFCLLIRDMKETGDVSKIGQRILDLMAEPFQIGGQETFISISIGIACYPDHDLPAEELLKAAEKAAYCAKQEGNNNLLFYTDGMHARAFERLALEMSLRRAVERNELVLHYQPRVDVKTGRIVGVEALVRWNHPELGRVSPMQFIPLAEETGLIVPIGEWILATACEQNKRWQAAGLAPVRMAVNLSSVQFRQRDLYETVTSILRTTGLDPQWLELELTESLLMRDAESAITSLRRFKDLGLHLSIDDFGTGYSSLSYLKRFPIDALKIDQSFIREMTTSADDSALVTAIILMGRSLKLRVVAEGVETRSQLAFLRILQCDEIQGYLISRPVPADEMAGILSSPVSASFAA